MSFLIFFIILSILILSHELGHFLAAKFTNTKVEEFGFGFPPKIFRFKKGETTYSLNLFPVGGFVKILGEDGTEKKELEDAAFLDDKNRSFSFKPTYVKILILSAGVLFNLLLAWILLSFSFASGSLEQISDNDVSYSSPQVIITEILENSPAEKIGLKPGDIITRLALPARHGLDVSRTIDAQNFIKENRGKEIEITVKKENGAVLSLKVDLQNIEPEKGALGVAMARVAVFKPPFYLAVIYGLKDTLSLTAAIAVAMFYFFAGLFTGHGIEQVAGPIGIFNIVSGASRLGISYLARLAAVLSINLAIINFFPFPALDGGRVFMVLIEKIKGTPIKQKYANALNTVGFIILIILMIFITYNDVFKIIKKS